MPAQDRAEIISALAGVDAVVIWDDGKDDVSAALEYIQPDIFAKGGDRNSLAKIPEAAVCKRIGCKIIFNVGGGKIESSSWLLERFSKKKPK